MYQLTVRPIVEKSCKRAWRCVYHSASTVTNDKVKARRRYRRDFREITRKFTSDPETWDSEVFHLRSYTSWDVW